MLLLTLAGHADLATVVHCALRELASYRAPKTNERALLLRPHQTLTDMHMRDRAELEFQKQCVEALFPVRLCLRSAQRELGNRDAVQARPAAKSAPRSLRRALLTSQVNPGSLYRCGRRT